MESKKVILVLINDSLDGFFEMSSLLESAGYELIFTFTQKVVRISSAFYIGRGKLNEIAFYYETNNLSKDTPLIFNTNLTGMQHRNLEEMLGVPIIDRTELILEIFKRGANTPESKLQVEIASLKYQVSRLVNKEANYSQVTSGGHNKGKGETQNELTRRELRRLIKQKERQLENIRLSRSNNRSLRNSSDIPLVSIVGYTNSGKSTLMNLLLSLNTDRPNKNVYSENRLFATLSTSARAIDLYNYPSIILVDTVGFINNLPNYLLTAFRSTLEEIKESDYLIEVVDVSKPSFQDEIDETNHVLEELGADNIDRFVFYNKSDLISHSPLLLKNHEQYSSFKEDDALEIFLKILDFVTESWTEKEIVVPLDFDFRVFQKENYVRKKTNKNNGYAITVRFNPRYLYKYTYLISD